MSNSSQKLLEVLLQSREIGAIKQGIISLVDKEKDTCTITIEGIEYENISLKITSDPSNFVVYPLLNTVCSVYYLEANPQSIYLLCFQDAESIKVNDMKEINISGDKIELNLTETNWEGEKLYISLQNNMEAEAEKIVFNGGNNGGLPITNKVVSEINKLVNQTNMILTILKAITVPTIPPYSFTPLFAALNSLPVVQNTNVENSKITQ